MSYIDASLLLLVLSFVMVGFSACAGLMTMFLIHHPSAEAPNRSRPQGAEIYYYACGGVFFDEAWACVRRHPKYLREADYAKLSRVTRIVILAVAFTIGIYTIASTYIRLFV